MRIALSLLAALIWINAASAQSTVVRGIITQSNGKPIQSASVHLLNTNLFTVTDKDGQFKLTNVFPGNYILEVSAISFSSYNKEISVNETALEISIVLNESYKQLGAVTVSSQKMEESLQEAPVSITALNNRKVEEYRLWNAKELTAISPVLYSSNPGDNRNVTSIRGIVSTSYEQAVATYVDGVNQFGLDTYIPELFDIERIEILRGPQGQLYGRNAMGGVINIITRKPANETGLSAQVTAGNYGLQRYTAAFRVPVIKGKLFFGAGALYEKSDGYFTNEFDNSKYDKRSVAGGNYYLRFLPNEKWQLVANVKHMHHRNHGAFPLVVGVEEAFKNPFKLNQNAVTKMIDDNFNASLTLKYAGRNILFTSQTAYQSNHRYYTDPIDADFSPLDAITIINNYGDDWNMSTAITQEFSLRSQAGNNKTVNWSVGSYLFSQDNPVFQTTHFGEDAQILGSPDKNYSLKSITKAKASGLAFYGEMYFRINEKLKMFAGLRYDHETKKQDVSGIYEKDGGNPTFPFRTDTGATIKFSNLSPRAGLIWHAAENSNIFLNYSRGFRSGGLTPLAADPSQPPLYPYESEHSSNIEAGIKNTFAQNRVTLNVSLFYTVVDNAQVPTLILPDAVTITRNTGELTSKGFEMELNANLWKKLQVDYSFGYCDAHYTNLKVSQGGTEVDLKGKKQLFTPDITSMLAMQFSQPLDKTGTALLTLRAEWKALGTHYFDLANTIKQPGYSLFNLRAAAHVKKFELACWARNIGDKRYIDYGYDFGAVHMGEPFTWGVGLGVRL